MALWGRGKREKAAATPPSIVIVSFGGREGLLPKFCFPLGTGTETIGRDEACSIQILDAQISRRQLAVRFDNLGGRYIAEDLGSANGTFINGQRLAESTPLSEGDQIEIGTSKLVFTRRRFKDQVEAREHFQRFRREGEHYRGTLRVDAPR